MNANRTLLYLVLSVVGIFGALSFWAESMSGDSGAGMVLAAVLYVFSGLAVPLCAIGAVVGLITKQGVKVGLVYGLSGALGLTGFIIAKVLFFH